MVAVAVFVVATFLAGAIWASAGGATLQDDAPSAPTEVRTTEPKPERAGAGSEPTAQATTEALEALVGSRPVL